ncbi:MAG: VOC family protein, partial [Candidatus Limnocylindrales bacterium]
INGRIGSASALALYIEAPDLDAYYARVGEQGVTVVDPIADRPLGQREFTIQDPQGNWLSFWEALPTDDEELALT